MWTVLLCSWFLAYVSCSPVSFSGGGDTPGEGLRPHTEIYPNMSIKDIPTIFAEDVVLSNCTNHTRYGYFISRPVDRMFKGAALSRLKKSVFGKVLALFPPFLHWGLLISEEPPALSQNGKIPKSGTKVPRPNNGTIFELRNSVKDGLISLDIKNWASYPFQQDKVKYLGTFNGTDTELITIGRAYIKQIGKEGFSNFYRNCQHFTTWYARALWPQAAKNPIATRADQVLGKLLWWFRDWKKTARWGWDKVTRWTGFKISKPEEVDSAVNFVDINELIKNDTEEHPSPELEVEHNAEKEGETVDI
jgi:hypothetical protein